MNEPNDEWPNDEWNENTPGWFDDWDRHDWRAWETEQEEEE